MTVVKDMLRFVFAGYSVWLEPEQFHSDLDNAIQTASRELGTFSFPPHVTLVYGISDLPETEIRKRFMDLFSNDIRKWPVLKQTGFITDIELEGVKGGLMDMAWMEVSYATSPEHEELVDVVRACFASRKIIEAQRAPWAPHASLAYANPEFPIPVEVLADLLKQLPTLKQNRRILGVSLWKTAGTIDQWKCLERIMFDSCDDDKATL